MAVVHPGSDMQGPGDVIEVECTDGTRHRAGLRTLPMYDPKGEIERGIDKKTQEGPVSWLGFALRGDVIGMNDLAIEQT